jgi:hydrogenase maturation protein HypF
LAALLYEKGLLDEQQNKPILGFVWDGTGYGEDGHIWGSESFLVNASEMKRVGHLSYVPLLAHHRMMKEPPVALLAFGGNAEWVNGLLPEKDIEMLQQFYANESLKSSSMGRLFDAVAAMLLRIKHNRYEGEAAMRLQCLASTATDKTWQPFDLDYRAETMSVHAMLQAVHDALSDYKPARLALRFHQSLVEWVRAQAERHEIHQLAFSGGVFQNALLIDLLETSLGDIYELFFHEVLPANDESVALGQIVYSAYFNQTSSNPLMQQEDVLSSTR